MKRVVRKDEHGLYIQHEGLRFRPRPGKRSPVGLREGARVWCSSSIGQASGRLTFTYVWGKTRSCDWFAILGDPLYDVR